VLFTAYAIFFWRQKKKKKSFKIRRIRVKISRQKKQLPITSPNEQQHDDLHSTSQDHHGVSLLVDMMIANWRSSSKVTFFFLLPERTVYFKGETPQKKERR
jgi:hypothetical protein